MRQARCVTVLILTMLLITGCGAASEVFITNKSPIPVIATVEEVGSGTLRVMSLAPGESRAFFSKTDLYSVSAAPSNEWLAEAKTARDYLKEQWQKIASMTQEEVANLQRRLESLDNKMKAQASLSRCQCDLDVPVGECSIVGDDKYDGFADIEQRSDGSLICTCATVDIGTR